MNKSEAESFGIDQEKSNARTDAPASSPLYTIRKCHSHWHVGDSGPYGTEGEAQRVADLLNAGVDWDVIHPSPASNRRRAEIDALLQVLGETWRKYPMLRLGQLIVNVLPTRFENDAFHIPDDELTSRLSDWQPGAAV